MKKITLSLNNISFWSMVVSNRMRKVLWFFARHAFLLIILFILCNMLFGEYLFYRYIYVVQNMTPDMSSLPTRFKENTYKAVIDTWNTREAQFNDPATDYHNPFQ